MGYPSTSSQSILPVRIREKIFEKKLFANKLIYFIAMIAKIGNATFGFRVNVTNGIIPLG